MKNHVIWLALLVAALLIATVFLVRRPDPTPPARPLHSERRPPSESPFSPPPANQGALAIPKPIVGNATQVITTVPIARDGRRERAAIDRSLKKIERTVGGVRFGPLPAPPRPEKTAP
ncbi:MAG: hypothetical protein RIQ93_2453 [Verrucomicrobiota bacterium]|jgi:hypothetical protein